MNIRNVFLLSLCVSASSAVSSHAQTLVPVFSDDFSTSTKFNSGNPYVGGFYSPQLPLQKWTGNNGDVTISSGEMKVTSTNSVRSAGIILGNTLFDGAGEYVLAFDMKSYTGASNNTAFASVWSASGFQIGANNNSSIVVDTFSAQLNALGNSQAAKLAEATFNTVGNGKTVNFTYDGTSAVGLFLGVTTQGFPFPIATFDNVVVSKVVADPIPEPSLTLLLGFAAFGSTLMRRRS